MPAKDFLDKFAFDAATFDFEQFKQRLTSEIDTDTDLSATKITALEGERDTLKNTERDLKVRLFDATVMQQGEPITPNDSPAGGAGANNGTPPKVAETDIFEKVD